MKASELRALRLLARHRGIQLAYIDNAGQKRTASPSTLLALLSVLGDPVEDMADLPDQLAAARCEASRRTLEPVKVVWDGKPSTVFARVTTPARTGRMSFRLRLENGEVRQLALSKPEAAPGSPGAPSLWKGRLALPSIPLGYHELEAETPDGISRSLLISAPTRSYSEPDARRQWGVFLPVYATHSRRSWGAGSFTDWQSLGEWAGSLGAGIAASLPLLASFLDCPVCEASPYSPASRLFWNEFYLDIERVPEFESCPAARKLVGSAAFQRQLASFRQSRVIDYSHENAVHRRVLELLARSLSGSERQREFERFIKERPEVIEYGRFRAACEQAGSSWHSWPERQRAGKLRPEDYSDEVRQYHCYVQWLAQEQIQSLLTHCRGRGVKLYLDLPLGVNPDGYDVWRERAVFALGASAGAPPDAFFSKGQSWGFPPLHPRACREQGYRYVLEYLRFQMRHTGLLRIDHVMGLHRLYWVPNGMPPTDGAYVTYPAEELHALLCLESVRNQTALVGENLGTVPPEVTKRMHRHGLRQMYVVPFEQRPDSREALRVPPARSIASLNTHDMPTFAAHWRGKDIADRAELGLFGPGEAKRERVRRRELNAALLRFLLGRKGRASKRMKADAALRACLEWLSASPAEIVLINLEDLWLEEAPQNVPGTSTERPNWRRKARLSLEEIAANRRFRLLLERLNALRTMGSKSPQPG